MHVLVHALSTPESEPSDTALPLANACSAWQLGVPRACENHVTSHDFPRDIVFSTVG
jgi:hypothetical protein